MLTFNENEARKADSGGVIKETGKYVGVITRAEKLTSRNGTAGLGLSFKTADGASANYLDIYTQKANGEKLWGANLVQSLMACLKLKEAKEGPIKVEKWTRDQGIVEATVTGYPDIMGKKIGLLLQKELQSHHETGADVERLNIVAVFQADTGLSASEILDGKTKPEKVDQKLRALLPIRDSRKKGAPLKVVGGDSPEWTDDELSSIKF